MLATYKVRYLRSYMNSQLRMVTPIPVHARYHNRMSWVRLMLSVGMKFKQLQNLASFLYREKKTAGIYSLQTSLVDLRPVLN